MKKLFLILVVLISFSCTGKDNLKLEDTNKIIGKMDVELYGCCVEENLCTTCEDNIVILNKKMVFNGEETDRLMILNPYDDIDYYPLYGKKVELEGRVSKEKKDGIPYIEVVKVKLLE